MRYKVVRANKGWELGHEKGYREDEVQRAVDNYSDEYRLISAVYDGTNIFLFFEID